MRSGLPLVPVDHLLGHVAALRLAPLRLEPPFACLLVSGGHTLVLDVADYAAPVRLGGTRDDAAGEAFDKGARLLELSEADGAALELARARRRSRALSVPARAARAGRARSLLLGAEDGAPAHVRELGDGLAGARADLAASYQAAIVQHLVERAEARAGGGRARCAGRRRRRGRQRRAARGPRRSAARGGVRTCSSCRPRCASTTQR